LGTLNDEHLDWKDHLEKIRSNLKSLSYLFKNLRKYCDIETLKTVYYSYVHGKISQSVLIWGNTNKQNITKIVKAQKKNLQNNVLCSKPGFL